MTSSIRSGRDLHRLFAHDCLAGLRGGLADLAVRAARHAHAHDVHGGIGHHVMMIVVHVGHVVFGGERVRLFGDDVAGPVQNAILFTQGFQRFGVCKGDHAAADDRKIQLFHSLVRILSLFRTQCGTGEHIRSGRIQLAGRGAVALPEHASVVAGHVVREIGQSDGFAALRPRRQLPPASP